MNFYKFIVIATVLFVAISFYRLIPGHIITEPQLSENTPGTALKTNTAIHNTYTAPAADDNNAIDKSYYHQAIDLLAKAKAGESNAQFKLAGILGLCAELNPLQRAIENDFPLFLSMSETAEQEAFIRYLGAELQSCSLFQQENPQQFYNDTSATPDFTAQPSWLDIKNYWLQQAYLNGQTDAVAWLAGGDHIRFDSQQQLDSAMTDFYQLLQQQHPAALLNLLYIPDLWPEDNSYMLMFDYACQQASHTKDCGLLPTAKSPDKNAFFQLALKLQRLRACYIQEETAQGLPLHLIQRDEEQRYACVITPNFASWSQQHLKINYQANDIQPQAKLMLKSLKQTNLNHGLAVKWRLKSQAGTLAQ